MLQSTMTDSLERWAIRSPDSPKSLFDLSSFSSFGRAQSPSSFPRISSTSMSSTDSVGSMEPFGFDTEPDFEIFLKLYQEDQRSDMWETNSPDNRKSEALHQQDKPETEAVVIDNSDTTKTKTVAIESSNASLGCYKQSPTILKRKSYFNPFRFRNKTVSHLILDEISERTASSDQTATASDSDISQDIDSFANSFSYLRDSNTSKHGKSKLPHRIIGEDIFSEESKICSVSSEARKDRSSNSPTKVTPNIQPPDTESILDVRKALMEMEQYVENAPSKAKRTSRRKLMKAFFTVADCLDDSEREILKRQLNRLLSKEKLERDLAVCRLIASCSKTVESDDEEEDYASATVFEDNDEESHNADKENMSFAKTNDDCSIFRTEERQAVERALDDLLWTEFVASRKSSKDRHPFDSPETSSVLRGVTKWNTTLETDFSTTSNTSVVSRLSCISNPFGQRHVSRKNRELFNDAEGLPNHTHDIQPTTRLEHGKANHRGRSWWSKIPGFMRLNDNHLSLSEEPHDIGYFANAQTPIGVGKNGEVNKRKSHLLNIANPLYCMKMGRSDGNNETSKPFNMITEIRESRTKKSKLSSDRNVNYIDF